MKHILLTSMALAVALCCMFSFAPHTQAAGLTNDQKTAILGLLSAFGADQTTIVNVGLALNGQPQPGNSSNTSHTTPCAGGICPGETLTPAQPAASSTPPHSTTCSGGICPGETVTPATSATPPPNASGPSQCTIVDCIRGYHASGPICSAQQTCVPNTTTNTPGNTPPPASDTPPPTNTGSGTGSNSSATFSAWPNSGAAPLTTYFTIAGVTSSSGFLVNFGDGTSGSNWQADTEAPNTYFVSHIYTVGGVYSATLSGGSWGTAAKSATVMVSGGTHDGSSFNGTSYNTSGVESMIAGQNASMSAIVALGNYIDPGQILAAAIAAPFNLMVDSLTQIFVALGVGQ